VGLLWAGWFWLWFRDDPREQPSVNGAELRLIGAAAAVPPAGAGTAAREPTPWLALFASPAMWCIGGQQFFRAAGYVFYASWFPTFLKETYNLSTSEAGWLTSLPFWGVVAGSLVGGGVADWLLERTGSRRVSRQALAVFSMATSGLLVLLAVPVPHVWPAVALFSASAFCASLSAACGYVITIDMGGKHVALVFSMMNLGGNVGAMLVPAVIPFLVPEGTTDWSAALYLQAAIYLAGGVCWSLLDPNGTVFDRPGNRREPRS
jgi:nitrate/nitrite transporter NarK